jgi:hypothetical protein
MNFAGGVFYMPLPASLLNNLRETLIAGRYSLFLGAGVNVGGKLRSGESLPLGDDLRQQLVKLKGIKPSSSLARAYGIRRKAFFS